MSIISTLLRPGPLGQIFLDALTPTPKRQSLGEISAQTAKEGDARLIVYGRVRPIGGNLIHCQTPVRLWLKVRASSGKGGSKKKAREERVFRTYAIGVCEGPITAFMRIWRNGKLVYDARGNAWGTANNPVFLQSFRLYLGGWDQLPDATLERVWGVGQVPAYRGTAYMVAVDEDLTELGGAVPQWQFEVARAEGSFLTSRPYGAESVEGLESRAAVSSGALRATREDAAGEEELAGAGAALTAGSMRAPLFTLAAGLEATSAGGGALTAGELRQVVVPLDVSAYAETLQAGGAQLAAGTLRQAAVSYTALDDPESLQAGGAQITGGSLG